MSTQFWSHLKPTEPGHYWFHSDDDGFAFLVDVLFRPDGKWLIDTRTGKRIPNNALLSGLFKGPLQHPGPTPHFDNHATCAYCGKQDIVTEEYQEVIPWAMLCEACLKQVKADPKYGPALSITSNPLPLPIVVDPAAVQIPIHLLPLAEAFAILRRDHQRRSDLDSDDYTHWFIHTCDQCGDDWPCDHVRAVETLAAALGQAIPLERIEHTEEAQP